MYYYFEVIKSIFELGEIYDLILIDYKKYIDYGNSNEIKNVYSIRSSIVHSGKNDVEINVLNDILNYSLTRILVLLTNKIYENIKKINELFLYLKMKKYNTGIREWYGNKFY